MESTQNITWKVKMVLPRISPKKCNFAIGLYLICTLKP